VTPTLLVASPGGHLDELILHAERLGIAGPDAIWVTSRTAQSESLLEGQEVMWIPRIASGEIGKAIKAIPSALRIQRRVKPARIVTTGALLALPHMLASWGRRCDVWYIESATRIAAPSSTGKFARYFTKAKLFTQSDGWNPRYWVRVPSVFDAFETYETEPEDIAISTVVVSLGSETWPFPQAVERVQELFPSARITWQVGHTDYVLNGKTLRKWIPANELRAEIRRADCVIMHAGVGSVLSSLMEGKVPVILPRRQDRGEMIDNHQPELAPKLLERGLAVSADPTDLTMDHILSAVRRRVRQRQLPED